MTINEYQELAMRTANTDDKEKLLINGALGLCGESGEVADIIKKWQFQGHKLDLRDIKNELGDILWYVAIMAKGINSDLESIMEGNIDKLTKRYPDGFTHSFGSSNTGRSRASILACNNELRMSFGQSPLKRHGSFVMDDAVPSGP